MKLQKAKLAKQGDFSETVDGFRNSAS